MKSPIIKLSVGLSVVFLFLAQQAKAKSVLTWEQCVSEFRARNPELNSTHEAIYSAEAKKRASWSGFFPQLSANAGLTHGNSGLTLDGNSTLRDQYSLGVTATESLFSGFKDYYKVTKANRGITLTQANQELTKARLSGELKSTFASLLYNQEQLNLSASIVKRRQDNMRMVKLRYEGGRENKGSFLFSKASLEQALFENQQIQRATEVAKLNLARVLGRSTDLDFDISGSLTWNPVEPHPDFKKWVHETPDYRQAEAQWQVAEADSLIARGDFFPEISLQGSYSKVGSNFPPDTKRWSVGVSIAFPFFPGGQNIFNYQSANAEAHRADLLKTNADNVILAKLQQTHAALLDAMGLQKVAKEFVEASEARAIVSRGKYQTGLMSFEDWDLIETDLINRQKTELQSRRDVVLAEAAFEQTQGKSVLP
jgi:outer membrane protein TolC